MIKRRSNLLCLQLSQKHGNVHSQCGILSIVHVFLLRVADTRDIILIQGGLRKLKTT